MPERGGGQRQFGHAGGFVGQFKVSQQTECRSQRLIGFRMNVERRSVAARFGDVRPMHEGVVKASCGADG